MTEKSIPWFIGKKRRNAGRSRGAQPILGKRHAAEFYGAIFFAMPDSRNLFDVAQQAIVSVETIRHGSRWFPNRSAKTCWRRAYL